MHDAKKTQAFLILLIIMSWVDMVVILVTSPATRYELKGIVLWLWAWGIYWDILYFLGKYPREKVQALPIILRMVPRVNPRIFKEQGHVNNKVETITIIHTHYELRMPLNGIEPM